MNIKFQNMLYPAYVMKDLICGLWYDSRSKVSPAYAVRIQNRNLRKMIRHAYTIPFWKERFDRAGVKPEDIRTREDLQKLPPLTKPEYREWIMTSVEKGGYEGWRIGSTTGTSGVPLTVYKWPKDLAQEVANTFRGAIVQRRGFHLFLDTTFSTMRPKPKNPVVSRIPYVVQASSVSDTKELVETYNRLKPAFYYGNKSALLILAQYATAHNISLHQPKCLASISEKLDPAARRVIAEAFGENKLYDIYGCRETGNFAVDRIDAPGDHVVWSNNYCINLADSELIAETPYPRYRGKLLITSLVHHGFPLINYVTGDTIEIETRDGIVHILNILGRSNDVIKNADGTSFTYLHTIAMLHDQAQITQYRVIQDAYDHLTMILAAQNLSDDEKQVTEELLRLRAKEFFTAPNEKKLDFEWCEKIPPDPNGKLRTLICTI